MGLQTQESVLKAAMQYQDALETYAFTMLRDWAQAQDAVQNAFVTVMSRWTDFQEGTRMFAWVRAITRLKSLEALRARKRTVALEDDKLAVAAEQALTRFLDDDAAEHQHEMVSHLRTCMEGLAGQPRDLLKGFYSDGHSYTELASRLKLRVEAIRKSLYRARQRLRECVERREAGQTA